MIFLENVHKRYGNTTALEKVNGQIPTDRFVAVLGPSGAGKSTLLRLLSFVEEPDLGSICLDLNGHQYRSDSEERPWPMLTCVFQRQFLWPHLTLRENLSLPLRRFDRNERNNRLRSIIEMFEMSSFIERYPNEVSGGQAQRAALARALVLKPELILIDEAHSGLDLEQQEILNRHLVGLREQNVGLIVVTHSLDFARKYADQVIVIEKGMITENGANNVLDAPRSAYLRTAIGLNS